ncbi:MAG: HAD family hydrolase [Candidatus Thermoplasmatota archaeon]|nr:HAD family hydrolase [Candidatus Thermoplasmatota archaeon]
MLEGVLFDLFGTIIPRPSRDVHGTLMSDLSNAAGVDHEQFLKAWMYTYRERITSFGTDTERSMELVLHHLGIPPEREVVVAMTSKWYDMTLSHFRFFDDVIPAFRDLRGSGLRTGLLTNCGPNVPRIVQGSAVGGYLDSATYSTIEGIAKPEGGIYIRACAGLKTVPSRTLFIGDGDNRELPGAHGAGLAAVKIDRGDIAGDYRILEDERWEPTIGHLRDIVDLVQEM